MAEISDVLTRRSFPVGELVTRTEIPADPVHHTVTTAAWTLEEVPTGGQRPSGRRPPVTRLNIQTHAGMRAAAMDELGLGPSAAATHVGIGTVGTPAVETDTALGTEVGTRQAPTRSTPAYDTERYVVTFSRAQAGNADRTVREAGLFTAVTAGTMLARVTCTEAEAPRITSSTSARITVEIRTRNGAEL